MDDDSKDLIEIAANLVKEADGILVTAGAGMSVDSGLPDFRGNDGFWKAYEALGRAKIPFTEIANGQAFAERPDLAWGFYGHRLNLYRATVPHKGFHLIKEMAAGKSMGLAVYTSNVDGAFQKAGFDPARIVECHGSIHYLQCTKPCSDRIWSAEDVLPLVDEPNCRLLSAFPTCPFCGALARPNILMFNDWAWVEIRQQVQQRLLDKWLASHHALSRKMVVIELGAGVAIPTVRRMGQYQKCPIIRINPAKWEVSGVGVGLGMGALEALERIQSKLDGETYHA